MSNIVNILHTVFECCLFGGVIFIYMRMRDLEWLINERIKCLNEGVMEKFEDTIHNFYDNNRYKIEECTERLEEYSKMIESKGKEIESLKQEIRAFKRKQGISKAAHFTFGIGKKRKTYLDNPEKVVNPE